MSNTLIGSPFQNVLAKVQNARVLTETKEKNVPMFGDEVRRTFDVNGDGKADARLVESTVMGTTRRELTLMDAKGRTVDTFVSGTRYDPFFRSLSETGKVWSHEHREYSGDSATPVFEVYERASNKTGALSARATTTFAGGEKTKLELDKDDNGSLETVLNR